MASREGKPWISPFAAPGNKISSRFPTLNQPGTCAIFAQQGISPPRQLLRLLVKQSSTGFSTIFVNGGFCPLQALLHKEVRNTWRPEAYWSLIAQSGFPDIFQLLRGVIRHSSTSFSTLCVHAFARVFSFYGTPRIDKPFNTFFGPTKHPICILLKQWAILIYLYLSST